MMTPATATLNATQWSATDNPVRELVRAFGLLERLMQPYFSRFGISGSQWGVLRTLHRAEGEGQVGLRLSELGKRLLIRPPSVTGAVSRMMRSGLVAQRTETSDLRAKTVMLTPKGRKVVARVLRQNPAQIAAVLEGLTPPEQEELHRLLGKLNGHLMTKLG
jgi:DNA-binding MarR family transcriptional regulator